MEQHKARKIGFFSALSICFSSVVGIGIFLKNASVGKNVEGNGVSWLITWIICGLLAILLAFHFGKIAQVESSQKLTGLSAWTSGIVDKKNNWFKKIVFTNYGFFYIPILLVTLSFFTIEFFFEFLKTINPNIKLDISIYVVTSLFLSICLVLNNYFSMKSGSYISNITSILKFIPLLLVIFIGIVFWNTHNYVDPNNTNNVITSNGFNEHISFDKSIQGIMLSIPSVLFAFDSFIGVGVLSKNIKGGQKAVSKVIVTAMILVTVVYCLICLSSIFHYNEQGTTVISVLIDSLPKSAEKGLTIFISLFIFISAFGTTNSMSMIMLNECRNIVGHKEMIFTNKLASSFSNKKAALFFSLFLIAFWSLIIFVPSLILKTDALIDGFSNLVVVCIFLIYGYLIFIYWKNVHKKTNQKYKTIHSKMYAILVCITLIGVFLVVFLNIFFVFLNGISNWNKPSNWGLFLSGNGYGNINNLGVLIFNVIFIISFLVFPFINYKIYHSKNKNLEETNIN